MNKRYVSIWFPYLKTDWFNRRQPALNNNPFVLTTLDRGRKVITALNALAENEGIFNGMSLADAKAIVISLNSFDDDKELAGKLLKGFAEWFIRYSPIVSVDDPDGLIIDVSGCAHLWGGEKQYVTDINKRLKNFGYTARVAMADTVGAAWAIARYGKKNLIIESGQQLTEILSLPPAALRLETETVERLEKLGLNQIGSFINMQRSALRRRFGNQILIRIDEITGIKDEFVLPVLTPEPFTERLRCLEPIVNATGIIIAIKELLSVLCDKLRKEEKGLRKAILKCYRVDGKLIKVEIGTNRSNNNKDHLFKLLEIKIDTIEPALGIELFTLDALNVEYVKPTQELIWNTKHHLNNTSLLELLDRIELKAGKNKIFRFLPAEHHWPENSFKKSTELKNTPEVYWKLDKPRPLNILSSPVAIEVTAPVPDYPPMNFRYNGKLHKILKADGPERIEQEWWLNEGKHRDYYLVEDEEGQRYWLFRSGHYNTERSYQWFIHGFFP